MRGTVASPDSSPPQGVSARLPPQRRGRNRAAPDGLASTGADHVGILTTVLAGRPDRRRVPTRTRLAGVYADFDGMASANDDRADHRST